MYGLCTVRVPTNTRVSTTGRNMFSSGGWGHAYSESIAVASTGRGIYSIHGITSHSYSMYCLYYVGAGVFYYSISTGVTRCGLYALRLLMRYRCISCTRYLSKQQAYVLQYRVGTRYYGY